MEDVNPLLDAREDCVGKADRTEELGSFWDPAGARRCE